MKPIKSFVVAMAGLAISAVTSQAQLTLNFASTVGSTIQFNGINSTFQFNSSTDGTQWQIGSEDGGTGSALGLFGVFVNSPFSYGPISITSIPGYTIQTATVTGPLGGLNINDGLGNLLTGTVDWMNVETVNSAGSINASLTVNVADLAYVGGNTDLAALVAEGPGSMDLSFQFSPKKMLSDLTSGSVPYTTSFSGSISVSGSGTTVPEPTTAGCFLLGLGALIGCQHFPKNRRSRKTSETFKM
jgi:hypothetical protein